MDTLKARLKRLLVWSQKYARTDMVYLARGGFWTSLNLFATGVMSIALAAAFANLLPKEVYGTYRYILSIAGMFGFLSLTGMNTAVTQAVARGHDGALPQSIRIQLRWNLTYTLALAGVGAYYLVRHHASALGISLMVLGALTPAAWAWATYSAFLSGKKDFKRGTQYSLLGTAIYFLAMLLAILVGRTAVWLIVAYAVSNCVLYGLLYALTIAAYKPKAMIEEERQEMFRYGKHLSFINALSVVAQQLDSIIVFKFVGPAELAVYAFANLMPERIRNFAKTGISVILPKLAEKNFVDVMKSIRFRCAQAFLIGILAAGLYILVVPTIFRLLFPHYLEAVLLSRLVALNLPFALPAIYIANVFRSQKLLGQIYISSLSGNLLRILLILGGGVFAGTIGVIVGKILGNLLSTFLGLFILEHAAKRQTVASPAPIP